MNPPPQERDTLIIKLLSDATFSRGDGVPGVVDVEVEHDPNLGLPLIRARTLRGLLLDAWLSMAPHFPELAPSAERVFGVEGSLSESTALRIEDGRLGQDLHDWVRQALARDTGASSPATILGLLTDIRRQTARDRATGAPRAATLRATRVVLRDLVFSARLTWLGGTPEPEQRRVLALAALATRHGGLGRNRGRGFLQVYLAPDLATTQTLAGLRSAG
jgi:hypothetical protein